ncbi:hypothetical protein [Micromonospora sp. DT227]|uniref:hypothetical protein n=1 Tax=Micromonospora sp. DT227 TaxID=3393433 RepID=UPI003CE71878
MTTDFAHNIDGFRAAREWADQHDHAQPDDRMLKAYGRALLASLGRCGASAPTTPAQTRLVCELPNGHGGWHRDGVTEWTTQEEPDRVRIEYGVRLTFDDGHQEDHLLHPLSAAETRVQYHRRRRAEDPRWRAARAEVIHRTVTTSRWSLRAATHAPDPEGASR